MTRISKEVKDILQSKMQDFFDAHSTLIMVTLCTSDGFNIHSLSRSNNEIEVDKVAAIASTLCAISKASAEQINEGAFNIATVESENGAILFLRTQYLDVQSVLCVSATAKMSLGEARFHCQKLSKEIEQIGD